MALARPARLLTAGALYVATSAHLGHCFGHDDEGQPPPVAPEAHAWVLELPDGRLDAGVEVLHPSSGVLLPVAELALSIDGDELARGRDTLVELDAYEPTSIYALSFTLDADEATPSEVPPGPYMLAKHGPLDRPTAWWHDEQTVAWDPAGLIGYVEVRDALGAVTWTNRDSMAPGGRQEVPREALERAQEILVCGVEVLRPASSPSAEPAHATSTDTVGGHLGHRSTFVVGRCNHLSP